MEMNLGEGHQRKGALYGEVTAHRARICVRPRHEVHGKPLCGLGLRD